MPEMVPDFFQAGLPPLGVANVKAPGGEETER